MNRRKKKKIIIIMFIDVIAFIVLSVVLIQNMKPDVNTLESTNEARNTIEVKSSIKTIDDYINEFGGTKTSQPKKDMCYVTKDGVEYTIYSDGEIVEGNIEIWDGGVSEPVADEVGNYNIYSPKELKWIADQVISGEKDFNGVTITLRKTIDLGARQNEDGTWDGPVWNPIVGFIESEANTQEVLDEEPIDVENTNVIDENLKRFAGVFQAENASIRGMRVESDKNYQGLFGFSSGVIQNIIIKDSYIKGTSSVGAIVGLNAGKVLNSKVINTQIIGNDKVGGAIGTLSTGAFIENVDVDERIILKSADKYIGGICGYANNNSAISQCKFSGVIDGKDYVGGISGIAFFGIQMRNCTVKGASITGNNIIGGIVGYNKAQIETCYIEKSEDITTEIKGISNIGGITGVNYTMGNIENVISTANIEATGDNVGGITGINNASITNALNQGNITVKNDAALKVGGVVGENASESFIYTSYSEGVITNKKHAGGIYGANFGQIDNCYYLEKTIKTDSVEDTEFEKPQSEFNELKNKKE